LIEFALGIIILEYGKLSSKNTDFMFIFDRSTKKGNVLIKRFTKKMEQTGMRFDGSNLGEYRFEDVIINCWPTDLDKGNVVFFAANILFQKEIYPVFLRRATDDGLLKRQVFVDEAKPLFGLTKIGTHLITLDKEISKNEPFIVAGRPRLQTRNRPTLYIILHAETYRGRIISPIPATHIAKQPSYEVYSGCKDKKSISYKINLLLNLQLSRIILFKELFRIANTSLEDVEISSNDSGTVKLLSVTDCSFSSYDSDKSSLNASLQKKLDGQRGDLLGSVFRKAETYADVDLIIDHVLGELEKINIRNSLLSSDLFRAVQTHLRKKLKMHAIECRRWNDGDSEITETAIGNEWEDYMTNIKETQGCKEFASLVAENQKVITIPDDWKEHITETTTRKLNSQQLKARERKLLLRPYVESFLRKHCVTGLGNEIKTPSSELFEAFKKTYPLLDISSIIFGKILADCLGEETRDRYHRYLGVKLGTARPSCRELTN